MLFNSIEYLIFFPLVTLIYFFSSHKWKWLILLIASYLFYTAWKPEYLFLILISTLIDYFCGYNMGNINVKSKRKPYLYISLISNLGILFSFKYFNFFNQNVTSILGSFGLENPLPFSDLILPMGISFYTFQTMSYSIDVYNGKIKYEKNLGVFALYVVFFPQLVAGPIERAGHLIKQFYKKHKAQYNLITSGLFLALWGFFKKVVIADRLALFVDPVYNNPDQFGPLSIIIATFFFAIQIYCDFSGYSDIAIGCARVLGFDIMQNFRQPYFSISIPEFWRRWHISLSSWFRDYVYIPIGGNRVIKWRWYYNLFITFFLSGIWHGASWNFAIWGSIHGLFMIIFKIFRLENKVNKNQISKLISGLTTFLIVCISWVFFRANTIADATLIFSKIFKGNWSGWYDQIAAPGMSKPDFLLSIILIIYLIILDTMNLNNGNHFLKDKNPIIKISIAYVLLFLIIFAGVDGKNEFIYFQF